jgi:hypothetical protein
MGQRTRRGMHHHKSRHRPPVPGSAWRDAAHPELTFPNPMTWSSPRSAQPGGKAKDTTKHKSDQLPAATTATCSTTLPPTISFSGPRTRETHHPHTRPAPRLRTARRARPALPPETSSTQPAPRTRRPRRPEPSQRNQDHVSFGLVGRVVLPHDVGADPAALGDLQASRPGPGPHGAAVRR